MYVWRACCLPYLLRTALAVGLSGLNRDARTYLTELLQQTLPILVESMCPVFRILHASFQSSTISEPAAA